MSLMLFQAMLIGCLGFWVMGSYAQVPQLQQNVQQQAERLEQEAASKQQAAQKLKKGEVGREAPSAPAEVVWVPGMLSTAVGAQGYDFKNKRTYTVPMLNVEDRKRGENQVSGESFAAVRGEWIWVLRSKKQGWQVEGYVGKRYRQGRNFTVGPPETLVVVEEKLTSPKGFFVLQNDPVVFVIGSPQEWLVYKANSGRKIELPKDNALVKVHANNISDHVVLEFQKDPRYAVLSAGNRELQWLQDPKQAQAWVKKLSLWQDRPLVQVGKSFFHTQEDPAESQPAFETSLSGDLCMMQSVDGNLLLGNTSQIELRHYRTFVLLDRFAAPGIQWCLSR